MQDSSCSGPIYAFTWMDGRIENTGHLILALHPPYNLILWDTSLGTKVWKKTHQQVAWSSGACVTKKTHVKQQQH